MDGFGGHLALAVLLSAGIGTVALSLAQPALARRPQGLNVSAVHREIDWKLVRQKSRVEFVFIRASRGLDGKDPYYRRNYRGATREAKLRVGPYHRAFPDGEGSKRRDAREEAGKFLSTVGKLHRGDLYPVLDIEPPFGGLDSQELKRWIQIWMKQVERKLDVKPMIYTSDAIWKADLTNTDYFAKRGHRLWIAQIGASRPSVPAHEWDHQGWTFWQNKQANTQGIDGVVDKNVSRYKSLGRVTK